MPHFFDNELILLYLLISIILLFLASISIISNNNKLDNFTLLLVFILITLFYGLRFPGTTDTKMYLNEFDSLSNLDSFSWGWGFYGLMKIISYFGKSHDIYIFASSLFLTLSLLIFVLYAFKGKAYKAFVFIAFFYSWDVLELSTNAYRQGVAAIIAGIACVLFYRKKFILSAALFYVALSFHWGAIVVILACVCSYLFTNEKIITYTGRIALLMFLLSVFIKIDIMGIVYENVSSLGFLFSGVNIASKADAYLAGGVEGANFYDFNIPRRLYNILTTIIPLLLFVLYTLNKHNRKAFFSEVNSTCIISLFAIMSVYGVLLISMTWFMRNFYWNTFFSCAIYPLFLDSVSKSNPKKLTKYTIILASFLLFLSFITMWRTPSIFISYP
ncbi:EpsG family protein [Klebsiella michiganensis]|uniref:EpsG family protein n=1 Tax=Klebsiella michiganensis TaxID=1134687 RepID=UPI0012B7265D|nr:EpsG family protein [Klebsiella michiganensis]